MKRVPGMLRLERTVGCTVVALLLATVATTGQNPTVQDLYADASAKEKAVRSALAEPNPLPSILKAVRTVVADFEGVVRRFPTSSFSDDALWHAGRLSLDAFTIFQDDHEKAAASRLLRMLASEYPASRLAKQVPAILADVAPIAPVAPVTAATSSTRLATIKDIRRTVLPDAVRVIIEFDSEVTFHDERIDGPPRVFVDLAGTRAAPALVDRTLRFEGDADLVRQVRIGRHPNSMTRVVLDVDGISTYSVYPLYSPYRLVIDCIRAVTEPPALASTAVVHTILPQEPPPAAPLVAGALSTGWTVPVRPLPSTPIQAVTPPVPARPSTNLAGGFSIARQLGLGVSRIVIDPGHGGHDPGATARGVTEAELVLDVSLRLEKLLAKTPGLEVVLTRRTDTYLPLQERTAIANREGADLFLSIHANASANADARGIETYFLNFANNRNAEAIAARENAASGNGMAALPELVKAIALNNKLDESRDFATYVQRAMVAKLKSGNKNLKDLGVKQAPFAVLIGAAMPSVLAEISFLTNAGEVRLLRGSAYRQRIAEALYDAIRKYQASLKTDAKVAQQQ
jgi:N-acetylmuramoyl-L-alanine amidase